MNRSAITKAFNKNAEKIKHLEAANKELQRQALLLTDKQTQYKEAEETHGRGKNQETALYGRVYWKEYFLDEDTGKKIWIERSAVVRKNGEWVNNY